jgi:hypothetical protein
MISLLAIYKLMIFQLFKSRIPRILLNSQKRRKRKARIISQTIKRSIIIRVARHRVLWLLQNILCTIRCLWTDITMVQQCTITKTSRIKWTWWCLNIIQTLVVISSLLIICTCSQIMAWCRLLCIMEMVNSNIWERAMVKTIMAKCLEILLIQEVFNIYNN